MHGTSVRLCCCWPALLVVVVVVEVREQAETTAAGCWGVLRQTRLGLGDAGGRREEGSPRFDVITSVKIQVCTSRI